MNCSGETGCGLLMRAGVALRWSLQTNSRIHRPALRCRACLSRRKQRGAPSDSRQRSSVPGCGEDAVDLVEHRPCRQCTLGKGTVTLIAPATAISEQVPWNTSSRQLRTADVIRDALPSKSGPPGPGHRETGADTRRIPDGDQGRCRTDRSKPLTARPTMIQCRWAAFKRETAGTDSAPCRSCPPPPASCRPGNV